MNADKRTHLRQRIDEGVKAAVAAALEEHRRAGRVVAVLREGRVVLTAPEPGAVPEALALREEPPKSCD